MNVIIKEILAGIKSSSSNLLRELDKLESSQWELPSKCHKWAIKDVASHMVAIDGFYHNSIMRSLRGDFEPITGIPSPDEMEAQVLSDGIAARAVQLSETTLKTKENTLNVLSDMESQINSTWHDVAPDQWDYPTYHPLGTISLELMLGTKLIENALHMWDIFSIIDTEFSLPEDIALLIMKIWTQRDISERIYTADFDQGFSVSIDLRTESSTNFNMEVAGPTLTMSEYVPFKPSVPDVVIHAPFSTFVLLLTARSNLHDELSSGSVKAQGSTEELLKFHNWFRGI